MTVFQAIILGIIQGITEFAPVSSSAHLVLTPHLLNWQEPSITFDVMLHFGTLIALIVFFRKDIFSLVSALWDSLRERSVKEDPLRRLAWFIVIGTVPAALVAFLFKDFFEGLFAEPLNAAFLLLATGFILWLSEKLSRASAQSSHEKKQEKTLKELNLIDSLVIGLAQVLAIAPGISRSGSTIAAGLWRGFSREAAARYSFLLAIPIILGATVDEAGGFLDLSLNSKTALVAGFFAAVLSGYLCIKYLLAYLHRGKLNVFAYYCWVAGIGFIVLEILR